jgi:hypothetical protein
MKNEVMICGVDCNPGAAVGMSLLNDELCVFPEVK